MKVKAKDVFTKAVSVLDELGWAQGQYGGRVSVWFYRLENQPCCVVGAVHQAAEDLTGKTDLAFYGSILPMRKQLEAMTPPLPGGTPGYEIKSITSWNDQPERTVDEVKALLLKAAEEAGDVEYEINS